MSTQTVYFNNPQSISQLQQSVGTIPGQVNTNYVNAAGDITLTGNVSMRQMQDQIYNLQSAVSPAITTAGSINTQSIYGQNTTANQNYRAGLDNSHSRHFYDQGGLSSENIQYLQLDSTTNIPTNIHTSIPMITYKNNTGTYVLSNSCSAIYFTGSANTLNLNHLRRREMWNFLQDTTQISATTGGYASYDNFTSAWGSGLSNISDLWTQGTTVWSEANLQAALADFQFHSWGNVSHIWRYDIDSKTIIARSVVSMTRELWGDSNNNWKIATTIDGYITSLGNDLFVTSILNSSTYGLLVFDINLNPITVMQASSFAGPLSNSPVIDYNIIQDSSYSTFGLQTDQIRGHLVKQWSFNELGTGTLKNLQTNQPVDIFSGNTGGLATIIYVSSSSQSNYNAAEAISNNMRFTNLSPLSTSKWDYASGKLIAWALCTGAATGSLNATGTVASANGLRLVPIYKFEASPDPYVAGDILQSDSFVTDPLTSTVQPLTIVYPIVDIRDSIVGATGAFRSKTGAFAFSEGFKQTVFTNGGDYTGATSGIQSLAISICCMTGSDTVQGFIPAVGNKTMTFPRNKRHYQDVYAQYYYQYTDATGTYYQQNFLQDAIIQLSDINVKFYIADGSLSVPQYIDTITGVTYIRQPDGTYKTSGLLSDPSPRALSRQTILNNGFAIRHVIAPYNFTRSPTGAGELNPTIPPNYNNQFNNSAAPVYADFNFTDGTVFDSTATYVSQEWDLNYIDWNTYIGSYDSKATYAAGKRFNTNYSKTGTYSATGIKDYFAFTQAGLATPVVTVRLPGEAFNGVNGSGVVSAGRIVFEVKGEVFNGQPMKMTWQSTSAGKAVLTEFQAKQLGIYGGGLYSNTSLWQDDNGKSHIFSGHGNTYYYPFSEMHGQSNYAARQFLADKAAGKLPCSATTLNILGLDNVLPTPQRGLHSDFTKVNTAIYNTNGTQVLDCCKTGITAFTTIITSLAKTDYAATGSMTLLNQVDGTSATFDGDQVCSGYRNTILPINAYGQVPKLSGAQFLEAWELVKLLKSYHNRYLSNRLRAMISNTTAMLDAATLTLQNHARGEYNYTPALHVGNITRDSQGLVDNWITDSSCNNDDEVEATVTCGNKYMFTAGKYSLKFWKISDCNTSYTISKSYNGKSRFACTYDGSLGQQPTSVSTNFTYGNVSDIRTFYAPVSTLGGGTMYLGKQGGKDVFYIAKSLSIGGRGGWFPFFQFLPTTSNTKINIDPLHKDGLQYTYSADGKIVQFHPQKTFSYYSAPSNAYAPLTVRVSQALTLSDDEKSIKYVWSTVVSNPAHPELASNSGTGTSFSTGLSLVNRSVQNFGYGGCALDTAAASAVNDIIISPIGSFLYVFRADTGEIIHQSLASDYNYNECNLSDALSNTDSTVGGTPQGERFFGAFAYYNGNLMFNDGNYGSLIAVPRGAWGRSLTRLNCKYQTSQNINLTNLLVATGSVGSRNSQNVVFTPTDAISLNNNQWCFITTFKTTDWYNRRKNQYIATDSDYDNLFNAGITAIAVYDPTNLFLAPYQTPSLDISTKFINGGSWYERTGISFKNLLASGVVKFLYAGQIPYKVRAQTPFTISQDQIAEAVISRRQKKLLQEYYRAKNGITAPYQDDGCYVENNTQWINTVSFKPYYSYVNPKDTTKAVIYNESLGYTDVGRRPLQTPL